MMSGPTYGAASDADTSVHGSWPTGSLLAIDPTTPLLPGLGCEELSARLQPAMANIEVTTARPLSGHERILGIASPLASLGWYHVARCCGRQSVRIHSSPRSGDAVIHALHRPLRPGYPSARPAYRTKSGGGFRPRRTLFRTNQSRRISHVDWSIHELGVEREYRISLKTSTHQHLNAMSANGPCEAATTSALA